MTPLVSVCIQTYQHKPFISECLDSVLNQKTNFKYEILLGEDASEDGTREICIDYSEKYPDKIKLFLHDRKNVIYINGKPTGRYNFFNNLQNAKGKYIAVIEGDDYWNDDNKLQRQVNYLKANSKAVMCFHNIQYFNQKNSTFYPFERTDVLNQDEYTTADLFQEWFIHTSSVLFRNKVKDDFYQFFRYVPSLDLALWAYLSKSGTIGYINDVLSTYRIHDGGVSRTHISFELLTGRMFLYEKLNIYFDNEYNSEIRKAQKELIDDYNLNVLNENKDQISFFNKFFKTIKNKLT